MSNNKKDFVKSVLSYFLGNVMSKVVVLLLLPLYTNIIPPTDYGYYDLCVSYANFFSTVFFFEIWIGTMRFMIEEKKNKDKLSVICSSSVIYLFSVILYFLAFTVFNLLVKINYFPLVLIYGLMLTLQNYYLHIARGCGKNILVAISGFISTCVMVALNVLFIVFMDMNYSSMFSASIIGIAVQVIMLEFSLKLCKEFRLSYINKLTVKKLAVYCAPFCVNSAAYWFLTSFNRVAVTEWLSSYQNGMYAIANKFSVAINLVGTCFSMAWQETAFKKSSENKGEGEFYSKANDLYIKFLFCGLTVIIPLIGVLFDFLIGAEYSQAKPLIPLALIAAASNLFSVFLGNIFGAIKRTKYIFISMTVSCLVNVALVFWLMESMQAQAANISLLAGCLTNAVIRLAILNKLIGLKTKFSKIFLYSIPLAASSTIFFTSGKAVNFAALIIMIIYSIYVLRDVVFGFINTIFKKIGRG